jgi:hypothetical protein
MADHIVHISKEIAALPTTLEPNGIYLVRVGLGCKMYVADATGAQAYSITADIESQIGDINTALQNILGE